MVQYEDLSDNAKKAIEQYRNCNDMRNGHVAPMDTFWQSCVLNNVPNDERNLALDVAKANGYWLNLRKKEENKK